MLGADHRGRVWEPFEGSHLDEALRVGKLSYAKVRALTRVATAENEARVLEVATYATGAQLERMVRLEMVLAPDEADLVMRAIDGAREVSAEAGKTEGTKGRASAKADGDGESPSWPSRPDGVVTMAEAFLAGHAGHGTGGDRYQVTMHVDQDPLAPDGVMAATLEDGTVLSAETLRRVACDCGIVAVAGSDPAGMTVGRRTRSIPPAIRRGLVLRDHGCAFPGCTHTRFLHGHHRRRRHGCGRGRLRR